MPTIDGPGLLNKAITKATGQKPIDATAAVAKACCDRFPNLLALIGHAVANHEVIRHERIIVEDNQRPTSPRNGVMVSLSAPKPGEPAHDPVLHAHVQLIIRANGALTFDDTRDTFDDYYGTKHLAAKLGEFIGLRDTKRAEFAAAAKAE